MGINNRNHPELQAEDRGAHSIKNAERKEPLRALVGAIQKFSTEDRARDPDHGIFKGVSFKLPLVSQSGAD